MKKYILYGIGEIMLVVIGILVALQIDDWNEDRKKQTLIASYIKSLHKDLIQDTVQINLYNQEMQADIKLIEIFSNRLAQKEANFDTLLSIARHDFLPYFAPFNAFNNSTYSALISSGNIDLLDRWLNEDLIELNATQLEAVKVIDFNMTLYMNIVNSYQNKYSWNYSLQFLQGKFQDMIWKM